jgi:hypothetical protein
LISPVEGGGFDALNRLCDGAAAADVIDLYERVKVGTKVAVM